MATFINQLAKITESLTTDSCESILASSGTLLTVWCFHRNHPSSQLGDQKWGN